MENSIFPQYKTCTKCLISKPLNDYSKERKGLYGLKSQCKVCANARQNAYSLTEKGCAARRASRKKYAASEKGIRVRRELKIEYRKSDNGREYERSCRRAGAANLSDRYIKHYIYKTLGMRWGQITPELIEMKREQLTLRRLARQLKEAANESSKDTR